MIQENKQAWADNLRVFATISVIFLHVTAEKLLRFESEPSSIWHVCNIYDSMVRFCVPVFVMLTGALLLPKDEQLGDFLKKRLSRILLPFLFWSLVYIVYNIFSQHDSGIEITAIGSLEFTFYLLRTGSCYHLWYMYMMIGLYLFMPILSKWVRNSTEKDIRYFLIVWFVVLLFHQPILEAYRPGIELSYFGGYIGYLVLGYYLSVKPLPDSPLLWITFALSGIAITAAGTYYLSCREGKFCDYFYNYLTPNVMIAAIGVFLFIKSQPDLKNRRIRKLRDFIGRYSFGIYLVHILILFILSRFGINIDMINPIIGIPVIWMLCLGLSALVVYLVNKMPFGKYISG